MQYGIPLLGDRVAPRCTIAESLLLLSVNRNKVRSQRLIAMHQQAWMEFIRTLQDAQVDTLICGGISRNAKELVQSKRIEVLENVAGSTQEITEALQSGNLRSGFGLQEDESGAVAAEADSTSELRPEKPAVDAGEPSGRVETRQRAGVVDCLSCPDRVCLRGEPCDLMKGTEVAPGQQPDQRIMESAMDIACEEGRTLCRLSELIYFCLDMKYRKLGLAFCVDLLEPAEILAGVLRRFFEVYPVCCKVGGLRVTDPVMSRHGESDARGREHIVCNPLGQARYLNDVGTDFNVLVGLCIGMDCAFIGASQAPVTTLLVKDRSLANNPIGALYSEYYLKEATRPSVSLP